MLTWIKLKIAAGKARILTYSHHVEHGGFVAYAGGEIANLHSAIFYISVLLFVSGAIGLAIELYSREG